MPITTKVVSSNPTHSEVYSIQQYVIKFVNELRLVGSFLRVLRIDLTELSLKVAFNTVILTPTYRDLIYLPKLLKHSVNAYNVFLNVFYLDSIHRRHKNHQFCIKNDFF